MADSDQPKNRFYSPQFKQSVLGEYKRGERGSGFKALAKRFKISGGESVIRAWYSAWDGTEESLKSHAKGHRPRDLSAADVNKHIGGFIAAQRQQLKIVSWQDVQKHVKTKTQKHVPLGTLRRYGHDIGEHVKRVREVTDYSSKLFLPLPPGCRAIHRFLFFSLLFLQPRRITTRRQ